MHALRNYSVDCGLQAFEQGKFIEACQVSPSPTSGSLVKAPLATPDPIDVFGDYAQVKVCFL